MHFEWYHREWCKSHQDVIPSVNGTNGIISPAHIAAKQPLIQCIEQSTRRKHEIAKHAADEAPIYYAAIERTVSRNQISRSNTNVHTSKSGVCETYQRLYLQVSISIDVALSQNSKFQLQSLQSQVDTILELLRMNLTAHPTNHAPQIWFLQHENVSFFTRAE